MITSPGVGDAHASLLGAAAAREHLAGRARWARPFYLALAAGTSAVFLTAGFAGVATVLVVTGAFLAVVAVLVVGVLRQGVVPRGFARLHTAAMVAWGVLYSAALQVGLNVFPGAWAFWVPAALAVATPLVVAAVVAGRAAGPR